MTSSKFEKRNHQNGLRVLTKRPLQNLKNYILAAFELTQSMLGGWPLPTSG